MKASIKFREDDKPLLRAKVPIGVLGLPFLSGLSAGGGDSKELRFDLTTAFSAGPAIRLSYRPNDQSLPFSVSIKTGLGPLGSPNNAPFSISAEFSLLGPNNSSKTNANNSNSGAVPAFSLLFKPRFGDFCLKNCVKSTSPKVAKIADSNGEEMEVIGLRPFENGSGGGGGHKTFPALPPPNGLSMNVPLPVQRTGIAALLSGVQLTANSVLPLFGRAAMQFQWGLRVPPELQAAFKEDYGRARRPGLTISMLPLLVMSKITIEQLVGGKDKKDKKGGEVAGDAGEGKEGLLLMKRQLDALNAESGMLRRAVDDLRLDIGTRRVETIAGAEVIGGNDIGKRGTASSPPVVSSGKGDRRGNGKDATESGLKVATDDVEEELKKALDARRAK